MENAGAPRLYLVREPEPLGNYFRPSAQEFGYVANLLSAGFSGGTGIVVEGRSLDQPHTKPLLDPGDQLGGGFVCVPVHGIRPLIKRA